ncbi:MAG: peptide-methionine (S)-S-oxide reductase [Thermoplasmata archaeon]|nr:peptide-methionine (S)-S-oxide reductase [Thermoplasmata archaeon]
MARELATLAGGCFWCIEAAFHQMEGVESAISGYMGGHVAKPTYEQVCGGDTGHAEVVQVAFDNEALDYRTVLEAFFSLHDPTTLNRQGADVGTQYRSAVFTHSPEQERTARALVAELEKEKVWDDPIVTEVVPAATFWPAEAYHQRYYERNPHAGYCMAVVRPKLAKFQKAWKARLKA